MCICVYMYIEICKCMPSCVCACVCVSDMCVVHLSGKLLQQLSSLQGCVYQMNVYYNVCVHLCYVQMCDTDEQVPLVYTRKDVGIHTMLISKLYVHIHVHTRVYVYLCSVCVRVLCV